MLTRILSFPSAHFEQTKQLPLTSLMIVALLAACKKQINGIPFGQVDVKGSFTALISRGLIIRKEVTIHKHTKTLWQVTTEALALLRARGIEVPR